MGCCNSMPLQRGVTVGELRRTTIASTSPLSGTSGLSPGGESEPILQAPHTPASRSFRAVLHQSASGGVAPSPGQMVQMDGSPFRLRESFCGSSADWVIGMGRFAGRKGLVQQATGDRVLVSFGGSHRMWFPVGAIVKTAGDVVLPSGPFWKRGDAAAHLAHRLFQRKSSRTRGCLAQAVTLAVKAALASIDQDESGDEFDLLDLVVLSVGEARKCPGEANYDAHRLAHQSLREFGVRAGPNSVALFVGVGADLPKLDALRQMRDATAVCASRLVDAQPRLHSEFPEVTPPPPSPRTPQCADETAGDVSELSATLPGSEAPSSRRSSLRRRVRPRCELKGSCTRKLVLVVDFPDFMANDTSSRETVLQCVQRIVGALEPEDSILCASAEATPVVLTSDETAQ